ncbi:endonuclease/exonuclease/phosphatase family protein [Chryseosolibacter indicus]|uniref:Endonuclease/exonuclease/phosphatase family protein n=1 Tax=Chryseosolibacter indicus TaxID=2782351 RepID=A0ABS5VND9_9BACT|nr:endonuclease/exonuclease/phosphatase family protein [Chryseosolibacter indicus]MBT1702975.1 endonuclease/exonuclease/phosphatase family protein [Chryseosolibacter indicus]
MRIVLVCFLALMMFGSQGQSFKVMTYNIRYDTPNDSINRWSNRKQKVFQLLKNYSPDIFGVQEALYNQVTDIQKNLPGYSYVGVGRDDGKQKGEFSALFYKADRFKVVKQNTFWLSEKPDKPGSKSWDAAITRIATWALLEDKSNSQRFIVINTHFDHIGEEARLKSAELLKAKAIELAPDIPLIITGDFNCTREEAPYHALTNTEVIELIDPAPEPVGTFCTFKVNSRECQGIDYIFVTNQWRADGYKVINDNDGKYYPSDHLPVVITLSYTD